VKAALVSCIAVAFRYAASGVDFCCQRSTPSVSAVTAGLPPLLDTLECSLLFSLLLLRLLLLLLLLLHLLLLHLLHLLRLRLRLLPPPPSVLAASPTQHERIARSPTSVQYGSSVATAKVSVSQARNPGPWTAANHSKNDAYCHRRRSHRHEETRKTKEECSATTAGRVRRAA